MARLEAATFSFEVIVVDDGGPEPLDTLIESYADGLDIRLIRQLRAGPAAARNAGAALARGMFLAFIYDDCTPAPDWLSALVRARTDDRRLLGGRVENALIENPYSTASEHISGFVYEYNCTAGARAVLHDEQHRARGRLVSCRRRIRDVHSQRDCRGQGVLQSRVAHDSPSRTSRPWSSITHELTFARFLRQHFSYGRGILTFR
jgi:glycosyltransferase involved in cell wall biosynthesis